MARWWAGRRVKYRKSEMSMGGERLRCVLLAAVSALGGRAVRREDLRRGASEGAQQMRTDAGAKSRCLPAKSHRKPASHACARTPRVSLDCTRHMTPNLALSLAPSPPPSVKGRVREAFPRRDTDLHTICGEGVACYPTERVA
eukprot:3185134-Rhodomonas_salina.1